MVIHTKIPQSRRRLLVAAYGLTSGLIAPAAFAWQCDLDDAGYKVGCYRIHSALPLLGTRLIVVATREPRSGALDQPPQGTATANEADTIEPARRSD